MVTVADQLARPESIGFEDLELKRQKYPAIPAGIDDADTWQERKLSAQALKVFGSGGQPYAVSFRLILSVSQEHDELVPQVDVDKAEHWLCSDAQR